MSTALSFVTLRRVLALLALVTVMSTGAYPLAQWMVHTLLLHGFGLDPRSWILSTLWLTLSGWSVELSLRTTPTLGALAFANLTVGLIALFLIKKFPPFTYFAHLVQWASAYVCHLLLYLAGSWRLNHIWAWDPIYVFTLIALPFGAALSWRLTQWERKRKL